jgi:tetratricopeptide (TPR) repeat protein
MLQGYRIGISFVCLCLAVFGARLSTAQSSTRWWPDPSTGLMWAVPQKVKFQTWTEANSYCGSLQFAGYSDWRLSTLKESVSIAAYRPIFGGYYMGFKAGIPEYAYWTSTQPDDQHAWVLLSGKAIAIPAFERFLANGPDTNHLLEKLTSRYWGALCTRAMEAELLQIAKDAQVKDAVSNVETLKSFVPLNKARIAYQTGQYQESITQAKNALLIKPDFAQAYWGIGISYEALGQWDLAITNLEAALKIEKNYDDAKDALKWAKQGQKTARGGKVPKMGAPVWK